MSLKEQQLASQSAVFNEWIEKHKELKPYAQEGIKPARTIRADDLLGFKAPDETWLSKTRQQRERSGQAGKPVGSQTQSTYTVQFNKASDLTDVVKALTAGANATGTTRMIPLYIAWEQAGTDAPPPSKCASITVKLP
jgi:hypothetical protein